jgi:hypothetical protein
MKFAHTCVNDPIISGGGGGDKCHAYMWRSFILGEEYGLFKRAIKFYLDGIDGEKVLLAQFILAE